MASHSRHQRVNDQMDESQQKLPVSNHNDPLYEALLYSTLYSIYSAYIPTAFSLCIWCVYHICVGTSPGRVSDESLDAYYLALIHCLWCVYPICVGTNPGHVSDESLDAYYLTLIHCLWCVYPICVGTSPGHVSDESLDAYYITLIHLSHCLPIIYNL